MRSEISRRSFLAAGVTVVSEAFLSACNAAPPPQPRTPFIVPTPPSTETPIPIVKPKPTVRYELPATYTPQRSEQVPPAEILVPHWDGGLKRRIPGTPLLKFVFIPGMGSTYTDKRAFDPMKRKLYELGFGDGDMLDISYRIERYKPPYGAPYDWQDTTRDPRASLETLRDMMYYEYFEQFPDDIFWYCGHSQGGFMAEELAYRFAHRTAGLVTLSGALKGADIVPTSIDRALAPLIAYYVGGKAGVYFLEMGERTDDDEVIERQCANLVSIGIPVLTFAPTNDKIVTPKYAFVKNSTHQIGGVPIETQFPMDEWQEWSSVSHLDERIQQKIDGIRDDIPDMREEASSAQLNDSERRRILLTVKSEFSGHYAALNHPGVHKIIQTAVKQRMYDLKLKI